MKAQLILENGMILHGEAFGHITETVGEVVFNTGMTGYQEVLTDPSYYGQIVTMTYPLIGNYGINLDDIESKGCKVKAFVVREHTNTPSNWRCEFELDTYLKQNRIMGLSGIDTRALTKVIRNQGTMKGIITVRNLSDTQMFQKLQSFKNYHAVKNVTTKKIKVIKSSVPNNDINNVCKSLAVLDFGTKNNILKSFAERGCEITVYPAFTKPEVILEANPDAIFLSNGPGDPKDLGEVIENIKTFIGKKPLLGICLGHQLLALALGGNTEKLKFGHRGCNHPVKDLKSGRVMITSQNHGYVVTQDGLPKGVIITHKNLNDETIEGIRHDKLRIMSIQFHPEACPGPYDTEPIFDEFLSYIDKGVVKCQKI